MVKKLTLFVLASMLAVVFVACNDDKLKDDGEDPEDPEVVVFPKASGVLDEASGTVALTFSVTDALDVDLKGPVVSLLLPAAGAGVEAGVLTLAAGTYDIVPHAHNFFKPEDGRQMGGEIRPRKGGSERRNKPHRRFPAGGRWDNDL